MTHEIAIIDPGGDADRLISEIEQKKFIPRMILLTHGHPDHTHGAKKIAQHFTNPILYHEKERILGLKADRKLKEFEIISIGPEQLEVLHSPGHTQGGILLVDYKNKLLFSGDSLFDGSIGRTDLGGDFGELMQSIREKIMHNPKIDDSFQIYPGHMNPTTVEKERNSNPFRKDFI